MILLTCPSAYRVPESSGPYGRENAAGCPPPWRRGGGIRVDADFSSVAAGEGREKGSVPEAQADCASGANEVAVDGHRADLAGDRGERDRDDVGPL